MGYFYLSSPVQCVCDVFNVLVSGWWRWRVKNSISSIRLRDIRQIGQRREMETRWNLESLMKKIFRKSNKWQNGMWKHEIFAMSSLRNELCWLLLSASVDVDENARNFIAIWKSILLLWTTFCSFELAPNCRVFIIFSNSSSFSKDHQTRKLRNAFLFNDSHFLIHVSFLIFSHSTSTCEFRWYRDTVKVLENRQRWKRFTFTLTQPMK